MVVVPCLGCSWRNTRYLPAGRNQAGDRHLKFHDERDNLTPHERRAARASPDEISQIRYFVLQLVWCLFAESLGLLGGDPVEQIVEALIADPRRSSAAELGHLFSVLATTDQSARGGLYHGAPYVNGGLFASPARVHLDPDELALVVEAARFEWREVDPTIFGSLMEGCLGQQRRFELGAHYTHEIDILRIVRPTIVEPWSERIAAASTPNELAATLGELCDLQVLDPACGCGNFLYVAYREIRRLEHSAKTRVAELAATTGLPVPESLPSFPIAHLHGIEIDEFTAMIARVTLWMGHKLVTDAYGAGRTRPSPCRPLRHRGWRRAAARVADRGCRYR